MMKNTKLVKFLITLLLITLVLPIGLVDAAPQASPSDGDLTIHKFEREPGVEPGEAGNGNANQNVPGDATALPGVIFELTQTHEYDAATDAWTEVTGQPFSAVTDADGKIEFLGLQLGRYKVQEIAGPDHINLNTDEYFVDIPMTNVEGTDVNYDVHIYPKNETIRGAVELSKIDGVNENGLAGVKFTLFNADGTLVNENLTTDENGLIQVDGLASGDYYFKEIATINGYVLGSQKVEFTVTESGTFINGDTTGDIVTVHVANFIEPEIEKTVNTASINRGEDVTYSLTTKLPGDIADYNNFIITDVLDSRLAYVAGSWEVTGVDAAAFNFTENGQQLTWDIADFAALADVGEVTITFDTTIAADAPANEGINNKATIDFANEHGNTSDKESNEVPLLPTAGSLVIIKQDGDTQEVLAGAVFELRNATGDVIATKTTDDAGEIDFGELDYGDYTLHETKAPNEYRKLVNPIDVHINSDESAHTLNVDNFKSGWNLPTTGGMGTIMFTFLGLTLIGSASFLLFRRKNHEA